jgi:phosphatidylinositol alpha 1,6-mannosyltransferase
MVGVSRRENSVAICVRGAAGLAGWGGAYLNGYRKVAFLPDTFHEVNGVAHTSRQLEAFVRRRQIPFLSVHAGPSRTSTTDGEISIIEIERSRFSFALDVHLDCDPFLLRYAGRIIREAKRLRVEAVHITGPGDMGILGCYVAWRLKVPLVMGWHTNLHEYAGSRIDRLLRFAPLRLREWGAACARRQSLAALLWFYRKARIILAPNAELVEFMRGRTERPVHLMQRGVDDSLFSPARRNRTTNRFRIGYVGRLTPEKNIRFLAEIGRALEQVAQRDFEFCLVGQGSELEWLKQNVPHSFFLGVLGGEELARAYADMDLFVFPSHTDTFGNVILEALASGVPCVVTAEGGPKFLVQSGVTGYIASNPASFIRCVAALVNDLDAHHAMREAARHYACGLSWDGIFEKLFRSYESCFDVPQSRSASSTKRQAAISA